MAGAGWLRLAPILLGTLVVPLDGMVNVAFPAVLDAFALDVPQIQWLVICYVLTYGALLLAAGRIGDVFGHARVFRFGLAWSAAAFVACALAPSYGWLLAARVLQGVGAALVLGCGPALATLSFPEAWRVRALAAYATGLAAGGVLGPLLGGLLVQGFGWPAVWWVRAPVALAALALARGLPAPPPRGAREPFDLAGAVLLSATVALAVLAVNRAPAPAAAALAVAGAGCAVAFLRRSARHPHPIIDPGLFRRRGFAALNLAAVMVHFSAFAVMLLAPFFLARALGMAPLLLGLVLAANAAGAMAGSALGGWLAPRRGARAAAAAGAVLAASGLGLVALAAPGAPSWLLPVGLAVQGLGLGLFTLAYADVVTATMRREDRGVAGSLTQVTRTLGVVAAASVLTLAFGALQARGIAAGAAPDAAFASAFRLVFAAAALLPLAALPLVLRAPR